MELTFDWVALTDCLRPRRRPIEEQGFSARPTAYLLVESGVVRAAYAEGEDLSEWIGAGLSSLQAEVKARNCVVIDREKADRALAQSLERASYREQVEALRTHALDKGAHAALPDRDHFIFRALTGGWNRLLPSSYGLYVRILGPVDRDLLVLVKRGELAGFHRPDLSFLSVERRREPVEIVKYLSDKHLAPVQGLFVPEETWEAWQTSPNPWREVAREVRKKRERLVPFRMSVAWMIATKAYLRF